MGCSKGVGMESPITKGPYSLVNNPMNETSLDITEPTSILLVIQNILNKSRITTKNHSIKLQYLMIIVPMFEVDWIKTQGEIVYQNLTFIHIVILNKSRRTTGNS